MKLLNFESENLAVDYVSFNLSGLIDITYISNYFFQNLDFNTYFIKRINGKWKSEYLNYDCQNQFDLSFQQYDYDPDSKSFWVGTKIIFSGKNATQFYRFIQTQNFDWSIFYLQEISLARFDLYYLRSDQIIDQDDTLKLFMDQSYEKVKLKSRRRSALLKDNAKKGLILRVGNRKTSNYLRVYQKSHGVEFELEIKNELIKSFQSFLFQNCLEEFEDKLSKHFYKFLIDSLTLKTCYTDWLVDRLRKIKEQKTQDNILVTDYLTSSNSNSFKEREYLFRLFQFLTFIQKFEGIKDYLGSQAYYFVTFPVLDFLKFISSEDIGSIDGPKKHQYKLMKVKNFLESLQRLDPIQEFSNLYFRSYVIFPSVKIEKGEGKYWISEIAIAEQLYNYRYPFYLPKEFLIYKDKHEMEVKLQLIQSLSVVSVEKNFAVEAFLSQFSISNQKLTNIKKLIINSIEQLKDSQIIEPHFKITQKDGLSKKVKQLTTLDVTRSQEICFYEIISLIF
jgi:hypothetical protein